MTLDWSRLQDVLIICIPVFAIIALGKILERRGVLNDDHRNFANWLTYNFALPALIFRGVAQQRLADLINIPLVVGPLCGILVVTVIFILLARVLKLRGSLAAAFVFGTFWANVSYMGFPLATNAYGSQGMSLAAVYNGFVMPVFLILAFSLIAVYGGGTHGSFVDKIKRAVINPIVLAALLGILTALAAELFRDDQGGLIMPGVIHASLAITDSFLKLIGGMGLPLALLAVGSSMHFAQIRQRIGILTLVLTGKLILLPLLVLVAIKLFFPDTDPTATAVAVILSATPNAVASFVVSRQIGVEEGFVSSMLVISTALSVVTLPAWLYIVLP